MQALAILTRVDKCATGRKNKDSGAIQIRVEWNPSPPAVCLRRLQVTIVEAANLPKMDNFGENDVYCEFLVNDGNGHSKRTGGRPGPASLDSLDGAGSL